MSFRACSLHISFLTKGGGSGEDDDMDSPKPPSNYGKKFHERLAILRGNPAYVGNAMLQGFAATTEQLVATAGGEENAFIDLLAVRANIGQLKKILNTTSSLRNPSYFAKHISAVLFHEEVKTLTLMGDACEQAKKLFGTVVSILFQLRCMGSGGRVKHSLMHADVLALLTRKARPEGSSSGSMLQRLLGTA